MATHCSQRSAVTLAFFMLVTASSPWAFAADDGRQLATIFAQQVSHHLNVPRVEQQRYATLLASTLSDAGVSQLSSEYVLLVDRNPRVQAAMIFWKPEDGPFQFIGATAVSTGLPGKYEHFETPLGVFDHVLDNPDFRSEGTLNEFGIRGYGAQGRRIFDFGWVTAPKGWGNQALSQMRLQVHATDPDVLEARLGTPQSKGCVRTNASFNAFLDRYGILDRHYEQAMAHGQTFWVLSPTRESTPWSGRYLVIVETERTSRPVWAARR